MNNSMKNRQGFTLIEVLLSLVILSIVFLMISNFFLQSLNVSERNNEHYVAINLARTTIAKVKNNGYPLTGAGTYTFPACSENEPNCTPVINNYRFTTKIIVEEKNVNSRLTPFTVIIEGSKTSTSLDGYIEGD